MAGLCLQLLLLPCCSYPALTNLLPLSLVLVLPFRSCLPCVPGAHAECQFRGPDTYIFERSLAVMYTADQPAARAHPYTAGRAQVGQHQVRAWAAGRQAFEYLSPAEGELHVAGLHFYQMVNAMVYYRHPGFRRLAAEDMMARASACSNGGAGLLGTT